MLNEHLTAWETKYPALVEEIKDGLYVDNGIGEGENVEVTKKKAEITEIFQDATFNLHKLHSNVAELEDLPQNDQQDNTGQPDRTFAKEKFGTHGPGSKTLGMSWNKKEDTLSVVVDKERSVATTKRGAQAQLASIYDPLGLVSPTTQQDQTLGSRTPGSLEETVDRMVRAVT